MPTKKKAPAKKLPVKPNKKTKAVATVSLSQNVVESDSVYQEAIQDAYDEGIVRGQESIEPDLLAARGRIAQLEAQLAGCSIAAHGWVKIPHDLMKGGYAWSQALEDVTHLRQECDTARELNRSGASQIMDLIVAERDLDIQLEKANALIISLQDIRDNGPVEPEESDIGEFISEDDVLDWVDCSFPHYVDSTKKGPVVIDGCSVTIEGAGPVYLMDAVLPDGEVVTSRFDAGKVWHLDPVPEDRRVRLTLACQRLLGVI